jgi:hypothetical protein
MKRAACLLLLFAVWLLAAPGASAPRAPVRVATLAQHDGKAISAVRHVVQPLAASPRVQPAPVWARLPALPPLTRPERVRPTHGAYVDVPDLREALRRVQTRRRVPRLSGEEPPWR